MKFHPFNVLFCHGLLQSDKIWIFLNVQMTIRVVEDWRSPHGWGFVKLTLLWHGADLRRGDFKNATGFRHCLFSVGRKFFVTRRLVHLDTTFGLASLFNPSFEPLLSGDSTKDDSLSILKLKMRAFFLSLFAVGVWFGGFHGLGSLIFWRAGGGLCCHCWFILIILRTFILVLCGRWHCGFILFIVIFWTFSHVGFILFILSHNGTGCCCRSPFIVTGHDDWSISRDIRSKPIIESEYSNTFVF
mmetsp:Transcript_22941/g.63857  ORF Transcript_22941/g.63857 Transcript_22941/m.63857 type:complete len:244 (-) Transcript_22941:21-752(-)